MAPSPPSPLNATSATFDFIDFAFQFIDRAVTGQEPATGRAQEPLELAREAEQLKQKDSSSDLPDGLIDDKSKAEAHQTESDERLLRSWERCKALADKIIAIVSSCKVEEGEGGRSIQLDDKRKGELEKCKKELESVRSECASMLQRFMNERQSADTKKLDKLRQRDASMEAKVSKPYDHLRQELMSALSRKPNQVQPSRSPGIILREMLDEAHRASIAQEILLALRYDGMESRKHTISRTHGDTYEWAFAPPKNSRRQKASKANFSDWLQNGDGIFWVTGNPGSGKSTLMKFVDNHETTRDKLEKWARGYKLVKASHYFWVNGSALQKSQLGLLREVCFAILRQCPDLLPQLCEERWSAGVQGKEHAQPWSVSELQRVLHLLQASEFKETNEKVRFCFFIDGLDEYSGDYQELLNDLRHLSTSPHIKICAASRPWNLFEEALGQDPTRMITMQELTNDDISAYVHDNLGDDEKFQAMEKQDSRAEKLVDDIIVKANGVFLWVYLAVRQVQRRLEQGDNFEKIEESISTLPSDLDDYFKQMLDQNDVFKQRETAQIFRVCIRARQPLALLAFSTLDPENPVSKRLEDDKPVNKEEIDSMHEKMAQQIELRGPDLLEVIRDGKYIHVTFTHRSVRDFLTHSNMDTLFEERAGKDFRTGEDFEPLGALCHMTILTLHRLDLITDPATQKEHYYALIDDCLDYAQDMEIAHHKAAFSELDHLEPILQQHAKSVAETLDTNIQNPLLPLAIRRNLCLFVKQRAEKSSTPLQPADTIVPPDRPLLSYALPTFSFRTQKPSTFHPEMVQLLLTTKTSNPNDPTHFHDPDAKITRKGTVWSLYLRTLYSISKRPKTRPRGSLALLTTEALIDAGAQYVPNVLTEDGNKGEKEILEFCFGVPEAARLTGLRAQSARPVVTKAGRTGSGTTRRPSWAKAKSGLRRLSIGAGGPPAGSAVS